MNNLSVRNATLSDAKIYFKWINDNEVRENSFDSKIITWNEHLEWFKKNIDNPENLFLIFQDINNTNIGQVRIQKIDQFESIIGISICIEHRGLGYGPKMLKRACIEFFKLYPNISINAYIKCNNDSSKKIFEKAGFNWISKIKYKNFNTDHYILYANRKI